MSFINSMLPIQKAVNKYSLDTKPYEILQAVLRARQFNTTIQESDNGINGKKRSLKINYYGPICSDSGTGTENLCDAGTVVEPLQAFFDISRITSSAVYQLNLEDVRYFDGNWSFSEHAMNVIHAALNTVRKKMAVEVAAVLWSEKGLLPDAQPSKVLPFIQKSNGTGTVDPIGLWEIERTFVDAGFTNPFIIGGSDVFYWRKATAIGGMNENGLDVSRMGFTNAYYDTLINTTAGDASNEHLIAFDPQMIKFVSFSKNAGMFATDLKSITDLDSLFIANGATFLRGFIVDPVTGLAWDLNIKFDDCNDRWTFQWKIEWDLFTMPQKVCNLQGVNGIFYFKTCPQTVVTCPSGSVPTSIEASTYTWNTSPEVSYPLFIHKLELADVTSYPDTSVANTAELRALMTASISGYSFGGSSTNVTYTGYSAIAGQINDSIDITFS